jgi:fluoride exporter
MALAIWVMLAGSGGVLTRFLISRWVGPAPLPTLLVNLVGCFLIGLVYSLVLQRRPLDALGTVLAAGFLGGFTTFSAFALETLLVWESGRRVLALSYAVASPVLGVAFAALAIYLGRIISK